MTAHRARYGPHKPDETYLPRGGATHTEDPARYVETVLAWVDGLGA